MKGQTRMTSRRSDGLRAGWRAMLVGVSTSVSTSVLTGGLLSALASIAIPMGVAHAEVAPFETVATLSTDVVPIEKAFEIPQAGAGKYRITLTDVGALFTTPEPAPLDLLKLVITRGQTVVAKLDASASAGAVDVMLFDATPGSYVVHVVGKPGPTTGSGPFSLLIENATSNTSVVSFSDTLSPPETMKAGVRSYQTEIDVPAGTYELKLADLNFPRALETSGVFVFQSGAAALTACLSLPEVVPADCRATKTVTLTAGKYVIVAAGALPEDGSSDAGTFAVHMHSTADGTIVHSRTVEIGRITRVNPESFRLNTGAHTLKLKDYQFPAALASGSVLVTRAAQVAALATIAAPNAPFTVAADATAYDVLAYTDADATQAIGTFQVDVQKDGGATVLSSVQVTKSASGNLVAFTYPLDVPTAGAYRAKLGDFQFPAALSSARLGIVQNGAIVAKTNVGDGPTLTLDLPTLAAGPTTAIAIVNPATGAGVQQSGGAFGLELTSNANSQMVLDVAQGVGPLVNVRKVSVTQAGKYDLKLTDLNFPVPFRDLMAVISRGAQRLGTLIVGSGGTGNGTEGGSAPLLDFDASVSNYSLTVISQPSETEHAGTYGLSFTNSPAGPSITLTSDSLAVTSGNSAKLTWSTQNATTCTASSTPAGAWTGSKPVSGTETTVALTSATTFKLSCTGAGGRSSEQSVNVTIAAASTSGGGGGSMDWLALAGLAGLLAVTRIRRVTPGGAAPQ